MATIQRKPRIGLTPDWHCGTCRGELHIERHNFGGGWTSTGCDACCIDDDGRAVEAGERCECCMERMEDGAPRYHWQDGRIKRAVCVQFGCLHWYAKRRKRLMEAALLGSYAQIGAAL